MDTLDHKLRTVIEGLTGSARTSKIISINAALLSGQLQHGRLHDIAALTVVATEIQRLSDESSTGISALHAILAEVKLLTQTINLAGRQRMLSQKIMKLFLLRRAGIDGSIAPDPSPLVDEFQRNLAHLLACPLNTPALHAQLDRVGEKWRAFVSALHRADIPSAAALNEQVLQEMQAAVQRYEDLAGHKATSTSTCPTTPASAPEPLLVPV
jgi:hypothetical protein